MPVDSARADGRAAHCTATKKAAVGVTSNTLDVGEPYLLDLTSSVDVQLVDASQWLISCDDDALVQGVNLAVIGSELIQFGNDRQSDRRIRLSRLTRGRAGSEWAMAVDSTGYEFVLIERDALQPISLPAWTRGSVLIVTQHGISGGVTATASTIVLVKASGRSRP